MNAMTGIRMKSPSHLGGFLKTEIIEPLGLSVTAAAGVLGVTRPALSALLNERAALSSDMALRVEKAFGVSVDTPDRHSCEQAAPRLTASSTPSGATSRWRPCTAPPACSAASSEWN